MSEKIKLGACRSCNASKSNKTVEEFLRQLGAENVG